MARKNFNPPTRIKTDANLYSSFIDEILSGRIQADKLIESRDFSGKLSFQYDER